MVHFVAGETITGGTSSNTAIIQSDAVGLKGVRSFDFTAVKQIGQSGSHGIYERCIKKFYLW